MAEKRKVTAREAKNNLEPFGYDGPARWTSIDAFVKANPRARAAVTANKGLMVRGFSPGGVTEQGNTTDSEYYNIFSDGTSSENNTFTNKKDASSNSAVGDTVVVNGQEFVKTASAQDGLPTGFNSYLKPVSEDAQETYTNSFGETFNVTNVGTGAGVRINTDTGRILSEDDYGLQYTIDGETKRAGEIISDNEDIVSAWRNETGVGDGATPALALSYYNKTGKVMGEEGSFTNNLYKGLIEAYAEKNPFKEKEEEVEDEVISIDDDDLIVVKGCTNPDATNYNPEATEDDGSCILPKVVVKGCTNPDATNYNPEATEDDGSCILPQEGGGGGTGGNTGGTDTSLVDGTTEVNIDTGSTAIADQISNFVDRAEAQAQNIQPQTYAEKKAAGLITTNRVNRLFKNNFGMTTYVRGDVDEDGNFKPLDNIPQGYYQATEENVGDAPSRVEQAMEAATTGDEEAAKIALAMATGGHKIPSIDPETGQPVVDDDDNPVLELHPTQYDIKYDINGDGEITSQEALAILQYGITGAKTRYANGELELGGELTDEQQAELNRIKSVQPPLEISLEPSEGELAQARKTFQQQQGGGYRVNLPTGFDGTSFDKRNNNVSLLDDEGGTSEIAIARGGYIPGLFTGGMVEGYQEGGTVKVAGKELTEEQLAQGQADLSASAILDPAGTVAAAPVANINPDTEGAVLPATTGQALGVAPVVTDPAKVTSVTTADPVTKVQAKDAEGKPLVDADGNPVMVDMQASTYKATKAKSDVETELKDVTAAKSDGPTKTITGQKRERQKVDPETGKPMFDADGKPIMETFTDVSGVEAAQGTAAKVEGAPTRTEQKGEMLEGATVDQTKVGEAFGTGEVKAASVKDELTTLMNEFEGDDYPPWAAGAMRKANQELARRGLSASTMAGQAIVQAMMESALPIAQIDAGNKQQVAMFKAEQRAKFMQMEFDQEFQAKVYNATKVSEIANMNFSADQQIALENARMAQTMNLANLNNRQAVVMAEAAQISQLELAGLSNAQQAQVQNAQNFLQIDMANLNNEQQTEIFKAQSTVNAILSDTAATNAAAQFNASSENQTQQFVAQMKNQVNQFNTAQINAMKQFNAGEENAVLKFNSQLQNQREVFNAQMYAQIAQANAKWRQDTTTINTAAANESNFEYAKNVNGLTSKAIDQIWQKERDIMSFVMQSSEAALDRGLQIILADKDLLGLRDQLASQEEQAKGALVSRFLFGTGIAGDFDGILKNIPFLN